MDTLKTKIWKHLRILVLDGFRVKQPILIAMLGRHQKTLQYLFLDRFNIKGTWDSCIDEIKHILPRCSMQLGLQLHDSSNRKWLPESYGIDEDMPFLGLDDDVSYHQDTDPDDTTDDSEDDEGKSFDDIRHLFGEDSEENSDGTEKIIKDTEEIIIDTEESIDAMMEVVSPNSSVCVCRTKSSA